MAMSSFFQATSEAEMTKRHKELTTYIAVFFASALSIFVSFKVLGPARGFISVWPLTAVELAFCIAGRRNPQRGLIVQTFAASGVVAAGVLCHLLWQMTAVILVLSQLEVLIAHRLLAEAVGDFDDLRQSQGMTRFGIVAIVCPAAMAIIAALPLAAILHRGLWTLTVASAIADSLGYVTILPLLLFFLSSPLKQIKHSKPDLSTALPALVLFLASTIFVFWQTTNPVLYLIFPPLLFVVFTLGLEGAVFATATLALIGSIATKFDHGPLTLMQTGHKTHVLFLLQTFLWIASATALPVGSLLGEQRRARKKALEAELIYTTLLQNTGDVILLSSIDGEQRYISPGVTRLSGWTVDEFLAQERFSTIHPDEHVLARGVVASITEGKPEHTFRYRLRCKDGSWRWVEASVRGYKDTSGSSVSGYVATVCDISERRQQERAWNNEITELAVVNRKLALAATTDRLTGLLNRRGLDEAVKEIPEGDRVSLLLLDVDHFKGYNDRYGHLRGDDCLRELGEVFVAATASIPYVCVARFGGEEFAILLPEIDQEEAFLLANDVLHELHKRGIAHEASPRGFVTVSIGISSWLHAASQDIAPMIEHADKALYESKRAGRNRVTCAEEQINNAAYA